MARRLANGAGYWMGVGSVVAGLALGLFVLSGGGGGATQATGHDSNQAAGAPWDQAAPIDEIEPSQSRWHSQAVPAGLFAWYCESPLQAQPASNQRRLAGCLFCDFRNSEFLVSTSQDPGLALLGVFSIQRLTDHELNGITDKDAEVGAAVQAAKEALRERKARPAGWRTATNEDVGLADVVIDDGPGPNCDVRLRYHVHGGHYVDEHVATYDDATSSFIYYVLNDLYTVAAVGDASNMVQETYDYGAYGLRSIGGGGPWCVQKRSVAIPLDMAGAPLLNAPYKASTRPGMLPGCAAQWRLRCAQA